MSQHEITPLRRAIYDWVCDDVGMAIKMTITAEAADKLEARIRAVVEQSLPSHTPISDDNDCSELELRAFHAANASETDLTPEQYRELVRDLWTACCTGTEVCR